MKNKFYYFLSLTLIIAFSCRDTKTSIEDITEVNDAGVLENKKDTLSVEDVMRLMNSSENPTQSYTAILTNDIEKSYFYSTSDTNKTSKFILSSKSDNVSMMIYKDMIKMVRKDSTTKIKIKDLHLVSSSSDPFSDFSKKPTRYKAVIKLKRAFESKDSMTDFTLNIF